MVLCLTIIGIPLGIASFKLAGAALVPFGKEVVRIRDLQRVPPGAICSAHAGASRLLTAGFRAK